MIRIILLFMLFVSVTTCQQSGKMNIISSLPISMNEVSGIEKIPNSDLIWMINDSGNSNELFGFNSKTSTIDLSFKIVNGTNVDWEDLATDQLGTIYIGDFGNNDNRRKDLTIYAVKDLLNNNEHELEANITTFYFEDQKKFPPKKKNLNYDVESFIVLNNYFYLFTRNRVNKFDGITKVYRVPAEEGHFKADLIDQFKTCDQKKGCQITSATILHETGDIALLSYDKVWILSNYREERFFSGDIIKIDLDHYSQKEGITFKDQKSLFITDERVGMDGGNLYLLNLAKR
jgi:hypothetical protein